MSSDFEVDSIGSADWAVASAPETQERPYSELFALFLEKVGLYLSKPVVYLSQPMIRAIATPIRPGEEGNAATLFQEKVWRVSSVALCILFAPPAVFLALMGAISYKIADLIKQKDSVHLFGTLTEKKEDGETKALTLNVAMLWGGLPIPLSGMRPPSERMDALVKFIKEKDPDVLLMQELSFDPAYTLYNEIKNQYAHFYTRIGSNPLKMESSLFLATKYPVKDTKFLPFPQQTGIYRGAFLVETEKSVYVTTHMEYNNTEMGLEQLDIICKELQKYKGKKPCYVLGDFNLTIRNHPAFAEKLKELFHNPYTNEDPTCSDFFQSHMLGRQLTPPDELVDYTLQFKDEAFESNLSVKTTKTADKADPYHALSDHDALTLTISS